jgi:O-antigen ligase
MRRSVLPLLDVGLAALAAAVWYVRPDAGAWPLVFIALGWILRFMASGTLTWPTPFDIPLLLFLAAAFVAATLGFNQDAQWTQGATPLLAAWAKYWYVVAALGLFFAIANLRHVGQLWRFGQVYALLAVVVAGYFVFTNDWTASGAKFDLLSQIGAALARLLGNLPGHRLNPNVAGGVIAMVMPFFAPAWWAARGQPRRLVLWSALILLALGGLLLSESRGAWLALAVAGGLWAAGYELAEWRSGMRGWRRSALALLLLLGLAALGVVLVLAVRADLGAVAGPTAADTLPAAGFVTSSTVISRLGLLQGGWALAQDYLFTGAGLGTTPWVLSTYYLLIPVYFTGHVHNLFLDMLIEQGLPGLVFFAIVLGIAVALAVRGLRTPAQTPDTAGSADAERDAFHPVLALRVTGAPHERARHARPEAGQAAGRPGTGQSVPHRRAESRLLRDDRRLRTSAGQRARWLLAAALVSMGVMGLHGLVDDVAYGSRALVLLFVPAAIIAALQHKRPLRAPRWALRVAAIAIALLAIAAAWQRNTVSAALYANLGALAQTQAELSSYRVPDRLPEQMRREADLSGAIGRFSRALAIDPGNRTANQRMGEIALARGQYDAARAYLEATYRSDPGSEVTWQLLGDAYLALGRTDDAFALWSRVADAPAKLDLEAILRFEQTGDHARARQAQELAARIRTERTASQ